MDIWNLSEGTFRQWNTIFFSICNRSRASKRILRLSRCRSVGTTDWNRRLCIYSLYFQFVIRRPKYPQTAKLTSKPNSARSNHQNTDPVDVYRILVIDIWSLVYIRVSALKYSLDRLGQCLGEAWVVGGRGRSSDRSRSVLSLSLCPSLHYTLSSVLPKA